MDYAQHLIERINAAPQNPRVDVLSNELLREFQRGYPVENLRHLLASSDLDLVAIGIWILSELGEKSRPLLHDCVHLLSSPVKKIRFWTLDGLYWTQPQDGCDLAQALKLLDDPDAGVRWKVLDLLSRLSREQIEAAYACASQGALAPAHCDAIRWLLSGESLVSEKIKAALSSPDATLRKYAAVAAARLRERNTDALAYASTTEDADVREFASGLLPS